MDAFQCVAQLGDERHGDAAAIESWRAWVPFDRLDMFGGSGDMDAASYIPTLWPIMGPITSSFGQREDPVLGNGEGEFHTGIDISAPNGMPIRATGDGVVKSAEMSSGYGREVVIDHGHGVETLYGHMSGFAVTAGETVV